VAAAAQTSRYCRRHHCAAAARSTRYHRSTVRAVARATAAPAAGGDNGMCQSVRIHGEWVQRCHFPGQ
jgi:hypothetical protein